MSDKSQVETPQRGLLAPLRNKTASIRRHGHHPPLHRACHHGDPLTYCIKRQYKHPVNPRSGPPLQSKRLLDQVRECARYLHYSLSTEKAYVYWVRWFVRFHNLRHPRDMAAIEVKAFLTMLATERPS